MWVLETKSASSSRAASDLIPKPSLKTLTYSFINMKGIAAFFHSIGYLECGDSWEIMTEPGSMIFSHSSIFLTIFSI